MITHASTPLDKEVIAKTAEVVALSAEIMAGLKILHTLNNVSELEKMKVTRSEIAKFENMSQYQTLVDVSV